MEEIYKIHSAGDHRNYVVERKVFPGFMANIEKNETFEVTRLRLIDNCEVSILANALLDLEKFVQKELS